MEGRVKIFDVRDKISTENKEYILGYKETGSHACYMIYGHLKAGEEKRLIKPGKGHEEIIFAVKGEFIISGDVEGLLKEGSAFHAVGDCECYLTNWGSHTAVYMASGGHSADGH